MDVGSIIGGGFRLVREKPAAVAVWGLLYMLLFIAMTFLMRPLMQAQVQMMGADPQAVIANMGAFVGKMLLFFLVSLVLYAILFAAAQRAVLQPERQGFFFLRLGMDELRLLALSVIFFVGFYIAMVVVAVLMSLLIGLLAAAIGSAELAVGMAVVEVLAIFIFAIWFWTRFSLAFPLTLLRGRIVIGEAWRITRGHFWTLFTAMLVIFLIVLVLWTLLSLIISGNYYAQLMHSGGDPVAMQQAAQQQMARQFGAITGMTVVGWIVSAIVGGLTIAIWGGAAATAARLLTFNPDEMAETFA